MVFNWVDFLLVQYFGDLLRDEENDANPFLFFKPLIIIQFGKMLKVLVQILLHKLYKLIWQ